MLSYGLCDDESGMDCNFFSGLSSSVGSSSAQQKIVSKGAVLGK